MFSPTLIADIALAIVWLAARALPVWAFVILTSTDYSRGDLITAIALAAIYLTILASATNTWPDLFWKYQTVLKTRSIESGGINRHQVRILGLWHNILMKGDGKCYISLTTYMAPVTYRQQNNFDRNFSSYISRHHGTAPHNTHSHVTYIRGARARNE